MKNADRSTVEALSTLLDEGRSEAAVELVGELGPDDVSWLFAHLTPAHRHRLVETLSPDALAELLHEVSEPQALEVMEAIPPDRVARVVHELESDERADLLSLLPPPSMEFVLQKMEPEDAADARKLLSYPADTAGGLMVTELLKFDSRATVQDVLDDLREKADEYSDYDVQYAYVITREERLVGVLRQRDLLFARADQTVTEVMIGSPVTVRADEPLAQLREFFEEHGFVGAPVLDADDRLVGVVRRFAVQEALRNQMSNLYRKLSGIVGGDELRSMPLHMRSARRLSWLTANIFLNMIAASVIAANQDTLAAVIVLAVFLPMISDMSGCSGNQAVAVSLRELTLGLVRASELARVLWKELAVGIVNGIVLGILMGGAAGLWKQNPWLGLVVGVALSLNTIVAVCLGGLIPLVLKRFRLDPALASGPLLTTVTDMCGFFFVLTLAGRMLDKLV